MYIIRITFKDGKMSDYYIRANSEAGAYRKFCSMYGNPFHWK